MNSHLGKHRSSSFGIEDSDVLEDVHIVKKMKDSDASETSSEETGEDDRLQRMAQAMKTIIEVIDTIFNLRFFLIDCQIF